MATKNKTYLYLGSHSLFLPNLSWTVLECPPTFFLGFEGKIVFWTVFFYGCRNYFRSHDHLPIWPNCPSHSKFWKSKLHSFTKISFLYAFFGYFILYLMFFRSLRSTDLEVQDAYQWYLFPGSELNLKIKIFMMNKKFMVKKNWNGILREPSTTDFETLDIWTAGYSKNQYHYY